MRRIALIALILVGCGSRDPWPGVYVGEEVTDARDCATGEPIDAPVVRSVEATLDRTPGGRLFFNGPCVFTLEELSDRAARFDPVECDTTTASGTPVHVRVVNGRADLDGDELALDFDVDLTSPARCLFANVSFVGLRE